LAAKAGHLVNQSQLAVPLSCGLTTPIGNNFARAIAERETQEAKTESYSNIQHRRPKPGMAFGSVRATLVPSNYDTEYFKWDKASGDGYGKCNIP
jgi:hypothetical protein